MVIRAMRPETVTIVRATKNGYGDTTATVDTDVPGTIVTPDGTGLSKKAETQSYSDDVSTERLRIFVPPGTDLLASDRVLVRGQLFEVNGEPQTLRSPLSGHDFGYEASVIRTTG